MATFIFVAVLFGFCITGCVSEDVIPDAYDWVPGMGEDGGDNGPANIIIGESQYYYWTQILEFLNETGDYPYELYKSQVGVYQLNDTVNGPVLHYLCGGVFINPVTILTSARCVFDDILRTGNLVVASLKGYSAVVSYAIPHENYNSASRKNDIAILHTDSALVDIKTMGDAGYGYSDAELETRFKNEAVNCSIFAANSSTEFDWPLYMVLSQTNFYPFAQCKKNTAIKNAMTLNSKMHICTMKTSGELCDAAAGSVLACFDQDQDKLRLMGIMVYNQTECSQGPNVFTRVTRYSDWIYENTKTSLYSSDPWDL